MPGTPAASVILTNNTITEAIPPQEPIGRLIVAAKAKFTRIPKVNDLVTAGVPTEAIPTYCALSDYSNNKTGLCWPKMETLAHTLNRSVRTVQRHLHLLRACGVIEFVNRRRWKGKFSSYTYKILHIVTTGHGKLVAGTRSNRRRTKPVPTTPKSPENYEEYEFFFGTEEEDRQDKYKQEYAWFFQE